MKKTTPAAKQSERQRSADQQAIRSVVTRLRANRAKAEVSNEPDIDLSELSAALDELPSMNATKVVALHRRIENGDYAVDSMRLANKVVELESLIDPDSAPS